VDILRTGNRSVYGRIERNKRLQAASDEFTVRVARTLDEACGLVETGFDYVTDMEDGKIFRRRK